MQYPSVGYGKTFWPHLLVLRLRRRCRTFLTLHEYSDAHPARRAAAVLLAALCGRVIFTTRADLRRFPSWTPFVRRLGAIPIGSNLPVAEVRDKDPTRVVYFGLIRPRRGLEAFLDLARLSAAESKSFTFEVVGAVDPRVARYASRMQHANPDVTWSVGLGPEQAAARVASASAAYLPYPDGASDRRGSLLGVLVNGVPTITTSGPATSADLEAAVLVANDVRAALDHLDSLNTATVGRIRDAADRYLESRTWRGIADGHIELYRWS